MIPATTVAKQMRITLLNMGHENIQLVYTDLVVPTLIVKFKESVEVTLTFYHKGYRILANQSINHSRGEDRIKGALELKAHKQYAKIHDVEYIIRQIVKDLQKLKLPYGKAYVLNTPKAPIRILN